MNLRMETEAYLHIRNVVLLHLLFFFNLGSLTIIIKHVNSKGTKAKDPQAQ